MSVMRRADAPKVFVVMAVDSPEFAGRPGPISAHLSLAEAEGSMVAWSESEGPAEIWVLEPGCHGGWFAEMDEPVAEVA